MGAVAAFVLGDNQRRLGHQAALEADQRGVFRRFSQFQVEFARQADAGTPVATGEAVAFVVDHLAQFGDLLGGGVLHRQLGDRALDQTPGHEHLARLFDTRAGNHSAAIRTQQHHAFMGQARQGAANDGAADPENFPQRFFAQLGAGRQTLLEDGLEDMRVDNIVLGTAAAGFACSRLFL
ncbi:hypothetical protein D9M71_466680 [compost metagenome]